jgi:hypothetical protein
MMHASHIIYSLAGCPPVDKLVEHHGLCRMCSQPMTEGQVFSRWCGADFTDQNKIRRHDATHVCPACIWVHAWNCPPGYQVGDAARGPSLRTYSHLWHDGDYRYASKGDKPVIKAFLREPKSGPWFACIADSGQKHLIPYTPVNIGSNVVRFEEENVRVTPGFWVLADDLQELLDSGVTKAEIECGRYNPKFLGPLLESVRLFEEKHSFMRRSSAFRLCLWLSQRNEEVYAARKAAQAGANDSRRHSGNEKRVSEKRSKPPKSLGPNPGPASVSNPTERRGKGLGHQPGAGPQLAFAEQGSLFGD